MIGLFMVMMHALWSAMVYLGLAKLYFDWILGLHFVSNPFVIRPFSWITAGTLLLVVFVAGYVMGWLFAFIWNRLHKGR
jgi:hypothetical protein